MKVGRNQPCPCRSGKKYKKCCLERDNKAESQSLRSVRGEAAGKPTWHPGIHTDIARRVDAHGGGVAGLTPYTVARIAEDPRWDAYVGPAIRRAKGRFARSYWTFAKVAAMTTEAIEEQLGRFGVDYSREGFRELAASRVSAWPISEVWEQSSGCRCKGMEVDFLGLAACELWRRLIPDRPSMEMLDDWMQQGYDLGDKGKVGEACGTWWKVWQVLLDRFTPEMTSVEDVDQVFSGRQSVYNWCRDFEDCLYDASFEEPGYVEIGRQYCQEWIDQFPNSSEPMQIRFRRGLAEFTLRAGRTEEGITMLEGMVERWPEYVWGYVGLAEAYSDSHRYSRNRDYAPVADITRAIEWLERGLATVDPKDRDRDVMLEMMEWLQREAGGGLSVGE